MKITNILSKIGIDKYEHYMLASLFACVLKLLLNLFIPILWASIISFTISLAFIAGKELYYDKKMGKGTPEWNDFWIGLVGILIGIL